MKQNKPKETKFTSGFWKFNKDKTALLAFNNKNEYIPIFDLGPLHPLEPTSADANLIAAAPEMYKALELIQHLLSCKDDKGFTLEQRLIDCCETFKDAESALRSIDEALAKARGES